MRRKAIAVLFAAIVYFCPAMADNKGEKYYRIDFQGKSIGYIQRNPALLTNYKRNIASVRKTCTYIDTMDKSTSERQIFEQTIFQKPYTTHFYSLEYIEGSVWENYRYWFDAGKVIVSVERNGKKTADKELSIRPGVRIVTDYFSILPLLENTRRFRSLYVIDPKQIDVSRTSVSPQRLSIFPKGQRILTMDWQRHTATVYLIKWGRGNGKTLRYWVEGGELLQIEDVNSGTIISLATKDSLKRFLQVGAPEAIGDLPYQFGKNYRWGFYYQGSKVGEITFRFQKDKNRRQITAQGSFSRVKTPYAFESETVYDAAWCPVFYRIREGQNTEIECDFALQGVKARYRRNQQILERFIKLPKNCILLDNNGIQHFAVALSQITIEDKKKQSIVIFHPRRMQCTSAIMSINHAKDGNFDIEIDTGYYKLNIKLDPDKRLLEYAQGNLKVRMERTKK